MKVCNIQDHVEVHGPFLHLNHKKLFLTINVLLKHIWQNVNENSIIEDYCLKDDVNQIIGKMT